MAGGSCLGGNMGPVYEYAELYGIPDWTCQQYVGKNPEVFMCSDMQKCMECFPPIPDIEDTEFNCTIKKSYTTYKVKEYGFI